MLSVVGLEDDDIEKVCKESNTVVANYLFPGARVLSGGKDEIEKARVCAEGLKARRRKRTACKWWVSFSFYETCESYIECGIRRYYIF